MAHIRRGTVGLGYLGVSLNFNIPEQNGQEKENKVAIVHAALCSNRKIWSWITLDMISIFFAEEDSCRSFFFFFLRYFSFHSFLPDAVNR